MATATQMNMSFENLFYLCYFTISLNCSTCTKTTNYLEGTKLVGVTIKFRRRIKNLPGCMIADILHKTLNLVISHFCSAEDVKEMLIPKFKTHIMNDCFS